MAFVPKDGEIGNIDGVPVKQWRISTTPASPGVPYSTATLTVAGKTKWKIGDEVTVDLMFVADRPHGSLNCKATVRAIYPGENVVDVSFEKLPLPTL